MRRLFTFVMWCVIYSTSLREQCLAVDTNSAGRVEQGPSQSSTSSYCGGQDSDGVWLAGLDT